MKIETKLSCGEGAWVFTGGHVRQLTVGQIRIEYTKSPGMEDGDFHYASVITNDGENLGPQPEEYIESYMCVETGIGSGSVWTLGKNLFLTRKECEVAAAEMIAEQKRAQEQLAKRRRDELLSQEGYARDLLARIEAEKAKEAEPLEQAA